MHVQTYSIPSCWERMRQEVVTSVVFEWFWIIICPTAVFCVCACPSIADVIQDQLAKLPLKIAGWWSVSRHGVAYLGNIANCPALYSSLRSWACSLWIRIVPHLNHVIGLRGNAIVDCPSESSLSTLVLVCFSDSFPAPSNLSHVFTFPKSMAGTCKHSCIWVELVAFDPRTTLRMWLSFGCKCANLHWFLVWRSIHYLCQQCGMQTWNLLHIHLAILRLTFTLDYTQMLVVLV